MRPGCPGGSAGGETSLASTCRLCSRHHRFVHEHGYRIERVDGELAFFHRGRRVLAEPPRVASASTAWAAILAANADRDIDSRTGQCGWDGQQVQYAWVVDRLAYLECRRSGRAAAMA